MIMCVCVSCLSWFVCLFVGVGMGESPPVVSVVAVVVASSLVPAPVLELVLAFAAGWGREAWRGEGSRTEEKGRRRSMDEREKRKTLTRWEPNNKDSKVMQVVAVA